MFRKSNITHDKYIRWWILDAFIIFIASTDYILTFTLGCFTKCIQTHGYLVKYART